MSVSGFSSAPIGKDPRHFCEGDQYRARIEAVATSDGGFLRGPVDRRFQTNGKMPPHMTYSRDGREWRTSNQPPEHSGYRSMGHPADVPSNHMNDVYGGGYHSMGHPSDVPIQLMNDAHPPSSHYDDPYMSGHPNHDPNSYPPSRDSEIGYPHSGRPFNRHSSLEHPSNAPGSDLSLLNDIHQQNGFADESSSRHLRPSSSSTVLPPSSHHSNGPFASRDYWRGMKPHPPQDHTHWPPPHQIHDGEPALYRQPQPDSNYRVQGSNYRPAGPETHRNFRSDSPAAHGPEPGGGGGGSYWRCPGTRDRVPVSRPPQWESGDPRSSLSQRRSSDSNLRKNFINPTAEDWWHNHISVDRGGASYSPSISSQSSWSPGFEETSSSPRLRMPHPSPSTPDDYNNPAPEFHVDSYHHHHQHHPHYHNEPPPFGAPHSQVGGFDKERRESGLLKTQDGGRLPRVASSPVHGKGGKVGKEERRPMCPRGPPYHDRRAPAIINGVIVSPGHFLRDPRQAGFTRSQRSYKMVLQDHSYSKEYREGCEDHPLFQRIEPCSTLSPDLLTELKSSAAKKGKAVRRASKTGSSTVSNHSESPTSSAEASSDSSGSSSNKIEQAAHKTRIPEKQPVLHSLDKCGTKPSGTVKPIARVKPTTTTSSSGKQPPLLESKSSLSARGMYQGELVKPPTSSVETSTLRESPAIQKNGPAHEMPPHELMAGGKCGCLKMPAPARQLREPVPRKPDIPWKKTGASETTECKMDSEEKAATPFERDPIGLPGEFFLDLDPEPTSGSNSNSTCCSESEELTETRTEDSDMEIVEAEDEATETADEQPMLADGAQTSDDESLTLSLPGSSQGSEVVEENNSPEKWSVSSPEPGKMRFSRLDNICSSSDSERLSVKQMTSNRIQLRNGRVLPASHLAYQAKLTTSPPSSDTPTSPTSSSSSPKIGRLRRSKRLAASSDPLSSHIWGLYSIPDSDSTVDQSFDTQQPSEDASSDESDFEMPDFAPKSGQAEYQPSKSSGEGRGGRGRRGRGGKGRWARRGGVKRGGGGTRATTRSSVEGEDLPSSSGVRFYEHKPRTREEDSVLQRRLALEMEVKRNEKIQSQQGDLAPQPFNNNTITKDDDRGSVVSETSTSSLESLHHSQSTTSSTKTDTLSTDFSPDMIARVKKISTARSSGDTPLHKCCRTGKFDMVRYLLTVDNVPVNVQDNAGWTPLHEASSNGHVEVAELLLQRGADSNACARDGTRPIHDAIEIGNMDMVRLLVERGADLLVEYGERTAVEFARDHSQLEIADYIKDVIQKKQEKKEILAAASGRASSHHQKTTPTRTSRKEKLLKQVEHLVPRIPVNGYGPGSVNFGEELDYPLFYVSPVIELSTNPHLTVYNFQISPPGTFNPRRHNFYMMDDLLEMLSLTEDGFISECHDVNILELTVAEFLHRMKVSPYNLQASVPERIKALPKKQAIKFVPLCRMLSHMLDILTENMDN